MKKVNLFLLVLLLLLSACSGKRFSSYCNSIFDYSENVAEILNGICSNNFVSVVNIPSFYQGNGELLWYQEYGKYASIFDKTDVSFNNFKNAIDIYKEQEITAQNLVTTRNIASLLLNDKVLSYNGSEFERILTHHYQSINYLRQGNLNDAMVEIRQAANQQRYVLLLREREINEAKKDTTLQSSSAFSSANDSMLQIAGNVQSAYLNAYVYYFSAVIRELYGDSNGAYIDYKKAYDMSPSDLIAKDLGRLVQSYGTSYDKDKFLKYSTTKNNNTGRIIIFYEQGLSPSLSEFKLDIFLGGDIYSISLPYYSAKMPSVDTLDFGGIKGEYLTNIYAMQIKNLSDKYPAIYARQISRLVAKTAAARALSNQQQNTNSSALGLAVIALKAASIVTERADLRSWRTLPIHVQFAYVDVPSGNVKLPLKINGQVVDIIDRNIKNNQTVIISVVKTPNMLYTYNVWEK